jgi:hypothetical protein
MKIELVDMTSREVETFGATLRQLEYVEALMLKRDMGVDFYKHIMPNGAMEARHRITKAAAGKLIKALKELKSIEFVYEKDAEMILLKAKLIGKG